MTLEQIVARFPALANPAQPIPPPPYPAGRYYVGAPTADVQCDGFFDPVSEFALAARSFRLRAPSDSTRLVPVIGEGHCLDPLVLDGDVLYFDPALAAEDGDLVLVLYDADDARQSFGANWRGHVLLTKLLRHAFGHSLLLTASGAGPLTSRQTILGVCRRIERGGVSLYTESTQ